MAIVFGKPKRKDLPQIIIAVLFIVVVIVFLFLIFTRPTTLIKVKVPARFGPPQINLSNLENELLDKLEVYPYLEEFGGVVGRESPFFPPTSPTAPTSLLPF